MKATLKALSETACTSLRGAMPRCLSAPQQKKSVGNSFSRDTFVCLDILKERNLPSSDLVLFSRDSTMA